MAAACPAFPAGADSPAFQACLERKNDGMPMSTADRVFNQAVQRATQEHCQRQQFLNLDSKISALLTHVSIMIAICMLAFQQDRRADWFAIFLQVEAVLYIAIATGCLIAIRFAKAEVVSSDPGFNPDGASVNILFNVNLHTKIYKFCLNLTIFVTIALLGALMVKFFI